MRIALFFINWNDSYYLPFIKSHYGKFCQRIVMYDNYSDDNSVELAQSLGMEVRYFGRPGELNDLHYLNVKNHCWKEERGIADYVVVCDADEFLFFGSLTHSCPKMIGYNMVSNDLPINDIAEIKTGFKDDTFAKQIIFSPDKVEEINFYPGCHSNGKKGTFKVGGLMYLLHMRYIGGLERVKERHVQYAKRMSEFNINTGAGHQYLFDDKMKQDDWNTRMQKASFIGDIFSLNI